MYKKTQKNRNFFLPILFSIILLIISFPAAAVDIGGKASFKSDIVYENSEWENKIISELEMQFFFPEERGISLENLFIITAESEEVDLDAKKLYLRKNIGPLTAKIGRQPVSWSYGSLINPIDYTLGAENLEEETMAKFVDAVELYFPLNWKSGLTLVSSDQEEQSKNKWGFRSRTMLAGYDISANYIKEDVEDDEIKRWSLNTKGDLGPLGIYGAAGKADISSQSNSNYDYNIYQLGIDYSYNFLSGSRLYLQGEYINFDLGSDVKKDQKLDLLPGMEIEMEDKKIEFAATNLTWDIDDFSSVGLMTVNYLKDGSSMLIPTYNYYFSSNLLLELRGTIFVGSKGKLFGEEIRALEMNVSYTF
ncbi:MAG: hypothetical protein ACQESS_07335 [Bacillota bacterium]